MNANESKYALSYSELLESLGTAKEPFPRSTMEMLERQGNAPKFFKIGRRKYCREQDRRKWLDDLAKNPEATK